MQHHASLSSLYTSTLASIDAQSKVQVIGLHEGQKTCLALILAQASLAQSLGSCLVLVFSDPKQLHEWAELLRCNGQWEQEPLFVQALSWWGAHRYAYQSDLRHRRLQVMCRLAAKTERLKLCLVSFAGLMQNSITPVLLEEISLRLERGRDYDLDKLIEQIHNLGYRQVAQVEELGQYSVRGGLLDVFSPDAEGPIRLEFVADTIVSMRRFTPETQLSFCDAKDICLAPVWEGSLPLESRKKDSQKLYDLLLEQDLPSADRQGLVDAFAAGHPLAEIPLFLPLFNSQKEACLLDYLQEDDHLVFVDSLAICLERYDKFLKKMLGDWKEDVLARHPSLSPLLHFPDSEQVQKKITNAKLIQIELGEPIAKQGVAQHAVGSFLPLSLTAPISGERSGVNFWIECLAEPPLELRKVIILVRQKEHLLRLRSVLQHHHLSFKQSSESLAQLWQVKVPCSTAIVIAIGNIQRMVWEEQEGLLILPEHQFFSEKYQITKRSTKAAVDAFKTFNDIEPGSLVVHSDHGIGRYLGMRTMEVGGIRTDFLILEYLDQDRLYLPVHRLNLLQRYASKIDQDLQPKLDKLQSSGWQKRKAKASKAIQDMADYLLRIYAQRKLERRDPFSDLGDVYFQFEADFSYVETPGQQQAIDDVNADLSSEQPMDRLVCGDVGFGKTEVALRAAMRVALDGGQVMLLAPTTLLSYQHFETFRARCKPYGIEVAVANRFVKSTNISHTLSGFAKGQIDILIGTHRLLSKDVKPSRLGLLIVDEEQRFGVTHKEAIKQIKASCDVLTLTATPIPRSLHMSLLGIRDISVITTAPTERLAIRTYIAKFDEELIRRAIEQELQRGGQVFFVHNKVQDIGNMKEFLQKLLPTVSIAIAHGQMQENNVESVIIDFVQQKYKVLLCTTIIESGIDMPNVNTIIINHADKFGLAQLYQMRGRVGRSSRQSYAYFLTHGQLVNREDARRRLEILAAHQELGVGFQIASYDMELRGTGNLLGGEQSGHIADIGFDMYMELLEKEMNTLRGLEAELWVDPEIKLPLSAALSPAYIKEEKQRLWVYKGLFSAKNMDEIQNLTMEVRDRYGVPPVEAQLLFEVAALKVVLRRLRVQQIQQIKSGIFELRFSQLKSDHIKKLSDACVGRTKIFALTADFKLLVTLPPDPVSPIPLQALIEVLLPLIHEP